MHQIEPYYHWRDRYITSQDANSPFYGKYYNEFEFTNKIYNYVIHPQWDDIGSPTLFAKILFADYDRHYVIVELIGEWNDCLQNDVMYIKTRIIDHFQQFQIFKFIFIGENVLNFHSGDDDYYVELSEELSAFNGWMVMINLADHVLDEMEIAQIDRYIYMNEPFHELGWRKFKPELLFELLDRQFSTQLIT